MAEPDGRPKDSHCPYSAAGDAFAPALAGAQARIAPVRPLAYAPHAQPARWLYQPPIDLNHAWRSGQRARLPLVLFAQFERCDARSEWRTRVSRDRTQPQTYSSRRSLRVNRTREQRRH